MKSILIFHLNHSNRIKIVKLWPKYKNWSKLGKQNRVYRYMSNMYRYMLAKNDQNTRCIGTCSGCTGTCHEKCPECVFFSHFSIFFHPKPTLYFIHTSKPFHIHLMTSIILKSSFNTSLISKILHELLSTHSNMGYDLYITLTCKLVRVYSKP